MKAFGSRMWRVAAGFLSIAGIAWAAHAFWAQDRSLPFYDPTLFVLIGVALSLLVYAALSAGMEWMEGGERFVFPILGFVLWGFTFGRLFLGRTAESMFALEIAVLPALLFLKAVRLAARDAAQEAPNQAGSSA